MDMIINNVSIEPDSALLPILLGILLPIAFVGLAVGLFIYIKKSKSKKLAEKWKKGAEYLTDTYALDDVNDQKLEYAKLENNNQLKLENLVIEDENEIEIKL